MARNTSVTLGEHFEFFVAQEIKQGRFQSVSEVVRAGLRKLEEDETRLRTLRAKLQEAESSPIAKAFDGEKFLKGMRKKHTK